MKTTRALAILAFAAVPLGWGCAKNKSAAADGGPADGGSAQASASAPAPSASGPQMTTQLAESTGASLAKQRWPQYHPKVVSAQRIIGGYKVNIQMLEPVGAHVIIDMQGNYVDGGTSNGEH
jgi:hypothetical protein